MTCVVWNTCSPLALYMSTNTSFLCHLPRKVFPAHPRPLSKAEHSKCFHNDTQWMFSASLRKCCLSHLHTLASIAEQSWGLPQRANRAVFRWNCAKIEGELNLAEGHAGLSSLLSPLWHLSLLEITSITPHLSPYHWEAFSTLNLVVWFLPPSSTEAGRYVQHICVQEISHPSLYVREV